MDFKIKFEASINDHCECDTASYSEIEFLINLIILLQNSAAFKLA